MKAAKPTTNEINANIFVFIFPSLNIFKRLLLPIDRGNLEKTLLHRRSCNLDLRLFFMLFESQTAGVKIK